MELLEKIQSIVEEARQALASAKSESDVEAVRAKTIGRNGAFTALGPLMGKIPPEQKREAGKAFNDGKQTLLAMIESAREALAGAGSADDGDAFSFGDGEANVGKDFDGITALPEGFAQSFAGQNGFIHSAAPPQD